MKFTSIVTFILERRDKKIRQKRLKWTEELEQINQTLENGRGKLSHNDLNKIICRFRFAEAKLKELNR